MIKYLLLLLTCTTAFGQQVIGRVQFGAAQLAITNAAAGGGGTTPVYVQLAQTNFDSGSKSSIVFSFPGNVTAGNTIVLFVGSGTTALVPSGVTDTRSTTYTFVTNAAYNGTQWVGAYVGTNITGGACQITIAYGSSGSFFSAIAHEYSGAPVFNPVDAVGVNTAATGGANPATLALGTCSATADNEMAVEWCANSNGSITASAGWTTRGTLGGYTAEKAVNTGSVTGNCVDNFSSDPYCGITLILKHQ
jgi:hypothetical protein